MRIGIIGTHWGRTHVGTFRHWGHEVYAILGRDAERTKWVAQQEGIPLGTTQASDLDAVDAIVIASPPATHAEFIERFCHKPILCEKPLYANQALNVAGAERVFVNYAFPFLHSARNMYNVVQSNEVGPIFRVALAVGVNMDAKKAAHEWLFEVATHPLYFVFQLFGPFRLVAHYANDSGPTNLSLILDASGVIIDVSVYHAATPGIAIDVTLFGTKGDIRLRGGYAPQQRWNFSPLMMNGIERYSGEYSIDRDIWYEANCQSVKAFLDVVDARLSGAQARAFGLADLHAAAAMEAPLSAIFPSDAAV